MTSHDLFTFTLLNPLLAGVGSWTVSPSRTTPNEILYALVGYITSTQRYNPTLISLSFDTKTVFSAIVFPVNMAFPYTGQPA